MWTIPNRRSQKMHLALRPIVKQRSQLKMTSSRHRLRTYVVVGMPKTSWVGGRGLKRTAAGEREQLARCAGTQQGVITRIQIIASRAWVRHLTNEMRTRGLRRRRVSNDATSCSRIEVAVDPFNEVNPILPASCPPSALPLVWGRSVRLSDGMLTLSSR